ncbi:hypothetical protein BDW74DRAFT_149089 [Aspergillus multicolor]|uniref:uncharacterized protein n=1 Tax=Aspergillus multicolor TaxID=41759 RepID=UPI003CCD8D05
MALVLAQPLVLTKSGVFGLPIMFSVHTMSDNGPLLQSSLVNSASSSVRHGVQPPCHRANPQLRHGTCVKKKKKKRKEKKTRMQTTIPLHSRANLEPISTMIPIRNSRSSHLPDGTTNSIPSLLIIRHVE